MSGKETIGSGDNFETCDFAIAIIDSPDSVPNLKLQTIQLFFGKEQPEDAVALNARRGILTKNIRAGNSRAVISFERRLLEPYHSQLFIHNFHSQIKCKTPYKGSP